jgi:LPS export ABC transporter protein LptC
MLKKNLIFTIILILILLLFVIYDNEDGNYETKPTLFYKEKATNLSIKEFDKNNQLSRKTTAKSYTSFDNKADIIKYPEIKNLKNNSHIKANLAKKISASKIEISGDIKISSDKQKHILKTKSLFAELNDNFFYGNEKVQYISKNNTILSNGIKIFTKNDIVELLGDSSIVLNDGNKIISKNIIVKKQKELDYASSLHPSEFISSDIFSKSKQGFVLFQDNLDLLGEVLIEQTNSKIITNNLKVSGGVYKAGKSKYTDKDSKINADNLFFDDKSQVIELIGNVEAVYE